MGRISFARPRGLLLFPFVVLDHYFYGLHVLMRTFWFVVSLLLAYPTAPDSILTHTTYYTPGLLHANSTIHYTHLRSLRGAHLNSSPLISPMDANFLLPYRRNSLICDYQTNGRS